MRQTSILDKFKLVYELSSSNVFYIGVLCVLIFLSVLFITTNRKNYKESLKTYGILYLIVAIFIGVKFWSSLGTMFDCMMNNLFIVFYFPNISVYLAAIVITNIIIWVTMFSHKTKFGIKLINSIVFLILHYLLILNLSIINSEKLDVFDQTSLYSNVDVHTLIELSGGIFICWILFLTIYKIIYSYLNTKSSKVNVKVQSFENVQSNKISNSIKEISSPFVVKREMSKPVVVYESPKVNPNTAIYEQMLTVEDYKLLLSILKEEKSKKNQGGLCDPIKEIRRQNMSSSVSNEFNNLIDLYSN